MSVTFEIATDRAMSDEEYRLAQEKLIEYQKRHERFILDYQEDFKRRTGLNIRFEHAERLFVGTILGIRDVRGSILRRQYMREHPWAFKPNKYLGINQ